MQFKFGGVEAMKRSDILKIKRNGTMNKDYLSKSWIVGILAFVCCLLWGSAIPTIKTGYELMRINPSDTASQILFAGIRFTIAGILALILGCLLGFAGVVLINVMGNQLDIGFRLAGEGCMLLSAMAYALSSVLIKSFSGKEDPVALSGYQFFMGGLILSAMGLAMGGRLKVITIESVGLLFYLAMVSAVAYSLWSVLLKYNPVSKVTVYGFMNPLCGVVLSAIILGESQQAFGIGSLIALILVCIGICIVNVPENTHPTS